MDYPVIGRIEMKIAAQDTAPTRPRVLQYSDVSVQVWLDRAPGVENALDQAIKGWPTQAVSTPGMSGRQTLVRGAGDGFETQSAHLDERFEGLGMAGATCVVIADLAQDYLELRPGCLALHCAAFRYNDRLIAMTGPSRAGKSTLAARLTQEDDMQIFCDDVLPLYENDHAIALGIAPRLRLPLPSRCSPAFKAHVARHMGPCDDRYGYLCAPNVAPHGAHAPVSVMLILDRRTDTPARLHEVVADEAMHFLLSQNMSDLETAESAFDRLSALLAGITCLRLVYSDLEEAVALIRKSFGGATAINPEVVVLPPVTTSRSAPLPQSDLSPDLCWARNPDVVVQHKADAAFLWRPGRSMIWHLNILGLAVWTLLEIPGSARDIAQVLGEQFPQKSADTLISDTNALLHALARDGLVEQAIRDDIA